MNVKYHKNKNIFIVLINLRLFYKNLKCERDILSHFYFDCKNINEKIYLNDCKGLCGFNAEPDSP
jgi:hypothetical protein